MNTVHAVLDNCVAILLVGSNRVLIRLLTKTKIETSKHCGNERVATSLLEKEPEEHSEKNGMICQYQLTAPDDRSPHMNRFRNSPLPNA